MTPAPDISVIVPMRNAAPYVAQTLASILEEKSVNLEVIVVNDGSTDDSAQIVSALNDPRIRMIDGPQQGIAASVNAGLAACRGAVTIRCDADDLWVAGRCTRQLQILNVSETTVAVCGGYSTIDAQGRPVANLDTGASAQDITDELRSGHTRTHFGTFAIRTALLRELGGARDYFVGTEDIDLQLRIACAGTVQYDPAPVYRYRLHDTSSTHTQSSPQRDFLTQQARRFVVQRMESGADDLDRGTAQPPPEGGEDAPMSVAEQTLSQQIGHAWRLRRDRHRGRALVAITHLLMRNPTSLRVWKQWLWMLLKTPLPGTGW